MNRRARSKKPVNVRPQATIARAPEMKHYDKVAFTTPPNTGSLILMSDITSQGVDDNERVGDSIFIVKLEFRYTVIRNTTSSIQNVRLILVQDKMGYNAPSITDIVESGPLSFGYAPHAPYNHYFMSRFRIIADWIVRTSSSSDSANATGVKKLKVNCKAEYVGGATFKNQIYLLAISDEANLAGLPLVNYVCRLYYTDQ